MLKVDIEKCIGCGKCVKDCFLKDIEMVDGKARIKNETCIKCGHCIAICPKNAVTTDEYNMDEVKEFNREEFSIEAEKLLNFIKFRRTVRQFKDKKIEKEKLIKIIEAGRFTQTGSNSQGVSYIVVSEKLEELKTLTMKTLKTAGENILADLNAETTKFKRYAEMWIKMYEEYEKNPNENDKLFFNAPSVVIVTADSDINGGLASSNMELMINALGLGTFFSGFFVKASQVNKEIVDFLGVKEGQKIVSCMVIGYPDVKYLRTVPRKEADISWK